MAEYIERQKLSDVCYDIFEEVVRSGNGLTSSGVRKLMLRFENAIKTAPTADVVEVVRCKDCKHWHEETGWCYHHSHFVKSDGGFCPPWESADWKMFDADYFCADGERRDNTPYMENWSPETKKLYDDVMESLEKDGDNNEAD